MMRVSPQFGAIAMVVDQTVGRGLPTVTAYVGDYQIRGYGDGDVFVKTPSGQFRTVITDNRLVAGFTQAVRDRGGFSGTHVPASQLKQLARVPFKELRSMFEQGELPISGTTQGDALYTQLFEAERQPGTRSLERLLTESFGYDFVSPPSNPYPNNREVFLDKGDRRVFAAETK